MRAFISRTILLCLALPALTQVKAQLLTSTLTGFLTIDASTNCTAVMKITQQRDGNLSGEITYQLTKDDLITTRFTGTVNPVDSTFTLKETITSSCSKGAAAIVSCFWCKKTLTGKWTQNNAIVLLKGSWENFADTKAEGCYHCNTLPPQCNPGKFEFRRIQTCNERLNDFVDAQLAEWKKKGKFETAAALAMRLKGEAGKRQELTNQFVHFAVDISLSELSYDPEKQVFTITPPGCIAPFNLFVPAFNAACFAEKFALPSTDIEFTVISDPAGNVIKIYNFSIELKCDSKKYQYKLP